MGIQSKSLLTYNNFVHAVSGAVGSVVGMVTFYPLDTVRCRLQLEDGRKSKSTLAVMKELVDEEGFSTLYRGMVPVLQSLWASNFVYFYAFHGLKNLRQANENNVTSDLLTASIAGIINTLITTPLWMVNTRMKMAGVSENNVRYESLIHGLICVYRAEGLARLWRGTFASLVLVANPAIHMALYQAARRTMPGANSAPAYFAMSAFAKAAAAILTYPIQLVQTKMRHGHSYLDLRQDAGVLEMLIYIIRRHGVGGLYKGMEAKLLQTVLTAALMFVVYEKISSTVLKVLR